MARGKQGLFFGGRNVEDLGIEGRIDLVRTPEEKWGEHLASWRDAGATHISVSTMGGGLASPQGHIDAIRRFRETVGDGG